MTEVGLLSQVKKYVNSEGFDTILNDKWKCYKGSENPKKLLAN